MIRSLIMLNSKILLKRNFKKMYDSLLICLVSFSLGILFLVCPVSLQAGEIESTLQNSESVEADKAPNKLTQKQMNDLFGEDPYLGQTSYLQSPDGYSQREN